MMHEEVIKYRELSGDTNPNTPISRIGGYLDGYEKALEQEPCEDTISRQAVLKMAYDMSEIDGEHFTEPCMVVDVEDIQKLPPKIHSQRRGIG